jgi:hypothetical protein
MKTLFVVLGIIILCGIDALLAHFFGMSHGFFLIGYCLGFVLDRQFVESKKSIGESHGTV